MDNSVNISIEAPIENQIQEITYDGQEIYQAPLSISDNLTSLAQKIDFSKSDDVFAIVKKEVEGGSDVKSEDEASGQPSQWPWDSVRNKVGGTSTAPAEPAKSGEGADSAGSPPPATRCILCQGELASLPGTPRLMDCLHSACEPCIRARQENRTDKDFLGAERVMVTCPQCQLACNPLNMIEQRFVIEKMAQETTQAGQYTTQAGGNGDQMCSSCEEPEPATSYCVQCAEYICQRCVSAHQRLKITKDHTIRGKDHAERTQPQPGLFCSLHPTERLALFCETCEQLTCRDCQLSQHRDHRHQFAHEMALAARQHVNALLGEVSYKRVLLASAMQVIQERQQLIADKKRALVHDITQAVVRLTNAISTRGKQLVLRLGQVCDAKQRTLSEKKEALERLAAVTDHCVNFVGGALEGSDAALLYSKRVLTAHLQRVKARRADIPNPEIPVRIQLQLDKLPELLRVISSIGAIVVDGKVDGVGGGSNGPGGGGGGPGGGGAQGPYHPPHSAVLALQHAAAMQQSMAVGHAANQANMMQAVTAVRGRHAVHTTPLRHPHVTSTTHPHHLQGMNEMNLRGLLSPVGRAGAVMGVSGAVVGVSGAVVGISGAGAGRPHLPAHAAMQQAYQQMMGAYAANAYANGSAGMHGGASGRRSAGAPRTPSPAPALAPPPPPYKYQQPQQQTFAKWHIPQHTQPSGTMDATSPTGVDFKIQLGRTGAVTSTNPEPPGAVGGGGADLDRLCADSVRDLMATIAKLDSNGVQVVCEANAGTGASASPLPAVHSSTAPSGSPAPGAVGAVGAVGTEGGDPNEDWCAVCMDGGQLMCCDKCPKVFHQYCHIPTIDKLPDETETWQCLLCVNFAELPPEVGSPSTAPGGGLTARERKLVERLTLELYCQYEPSLPFREPVAQDNLHYYNKILHPMCLDMIRAKLQRDAATGGGYTSVGQFVDDVRLIFRNAYAYNPVESQIYKDAQRLEEFFECALSKWAPEHAQPWGATAGSTDSKRPRLQ